MAIPRVNKGRFRARQAADLDAHSRVPLISVVAPAHNEEESLPTFVEKVTAQLASIDHEIIIVDDGSTDRTWATIHRLKEQYPSVRGLRFTRNFGHQSAILAGLSESRGRAVIMMDSDGQHPESLIPELIKGWEDGYDVVQAVRTRTADEGFLKKVSSNLFYRILVKL